MEELLQQLAEARGLPASLVERSAQARAQATGQSMEDVLNEWAAEEGIAEAPEGVPVAADGPGSDAEESAPEPPASHPTTEQAAAEPAPPVAAGGLSGAALLEAVAAARGMPEPLVERSAEARARKEGMTSEAVLQEWAAEAGIDVGVETGAVSEEAAPSSEPEPEPEEAASESTAEATSEPSVPAAAAVVGGLSAGALLDAVAEVRGMPAPLVERSAGARAKKEGTTTEAVLREWAGEAGIDVGVEAAVPPADAAPPSEPEPGSPPDATSEPSVSAAAPTVAEPLPASPAGGEDDAGEAAVAAASIEVIEPADTVPAPSDSDAVAARRRYPVWLAAALALIPLAAVLYLMVVPNGPQCGSAGQLAVDPETGQAVGCDGAAYGVGEMNAFAAGEAIYEASCAVCHGADGSGGAGPAMTGGAVLVAFPEDSCLDHVKWVSLGSTGWPESTYGATAQPVAGGMPGFETSLLPEEIAEVVLYERVAFGGEDLAVAEGECGFADDEAEVAASG